MKKYLLLLNLLILSCKPFHEVYLETPRNAAYESEIASSQDYFKIVIVVENSMNNSSLKVISNSPDTKVFYDGIIKEDKSTGVAEIIMADNYKYTYLTIDGREHEIKSNTFAEYRYLIVKKKNKSKKIELIYTNQLPGYW